MKSSTFTPVILTGTISSYALVSMAQVNFKGGLCFILHGAELGITGQICILLNLVIDPWLTLMVHILMHITQPNTAKYLKKK